MPLLWVQAFRYAPLALYAPGQVDPRIPADVAAAVGLGDLASAVAALVALIALRLHAKGATFYVPMIVVGHVMIIRYLVRRGGPPPLARVSVT